MTMKKTLDGSTFIDLSIAKKTLDGSTFVDLTLAKRFDGINWIDIPLPGGGGGSLSVNITPGFAGGELTLEAPAPPVRPVTTNPVTANASGGTGPYTYAWTRVSGSSAPQANSPTSATTSWTALLGRNQSAQAFWRCTVTDSLSATAFADVEVVCVYNYIEGGGGVPP